MTREILCHGPGGVVDDSLCAGLDSPPSEGACTAQAGCAWVAEAWTSCSNGCGHGQKTRTLRCTGPDGEVDASLCLAPMPVAFEPCVAHTACVWVSESWGDCSTSCGEGTKSREVRCQNESGQDVSADWCLGEAPSDTASCVSTGGCYWSATAWSPCSTDCGHGQRTRGVSCVGVVGEVDSSFCLDPKPEDTEACADASACTWAVESWGECSTSCGEGNKTREVRCQNGSGQDVSADWCPGQAPSDTASCVSTGGCEWSAAAWSPCSTDCGQGVQQRSVSCQGEGGLVPDNLCHGQPPAAQQSCTASSSCQWSVGAWGTCSSVCGGGQQSRAATCVNPLGGAVSESLCGAKPSTNQACQTQPCEVLRTSWGGGICWSGGACGGGFGEPEGCPSGYSETGFGQGCGNPIAHASPSLCGAATVGSSTWTLCRFMDVHGWGCPGNYPNMGVSVRRCTWQP